MTVTTTTSSRIPSFVRRKGRLSYAQERALQHLLPVYGLPMENPVIPTDMPLILEIGFGNGDNLLALAKRNPQNYYIGAEVYEAGIGTVLLGIEQEKLQNLRVVQGDAVLFLEKAMPHAALDKILIFFPDPWHKKKHNKRRLIQESFIELVSQRLKPNGIIHLATDWQPYAIQMLEELTHAKQFENTFGVGNYATTQIDRIETKFERRGIRLGHGVWDLVFRKIAVPS